MSCHPKRRSSCLADAALALGLASAAPSAAQEAPSAPEVRAVLDQYCVGCHSQRLQTAGLDLGSLDLDDAGRHAQTFEKIIAKLRAGSMPPPAHFRSSDRPLRYTKSRACDPKGPRPTPEGCGLPQGAGRRDRRKCLHFYVAGTLHEQ